MVLYYNNLELDLPYQDKTENPQKEICEIILTAPDLETYVTGYLHRKSVPFWRVMSKENFIANHCKSTFSTLKMFYIFTKIPTVIENYCHGKIKFYIFNVSCAFQVNNKISTI